MKGWLIFKHVILNLHIQNKYTYDIGQYHHNVRNSSNWKRMLLESDS